jgi:anaerobic dimethyl sulfoxide reductase subunit A
MYIRHAKENGAKIIMVDPWFTPTAEGLADEWVPVRPGTDTALFAAIAYHMIENHLQDQDFLNTYCVGFDADHMPSGEKGKENFKDYILGKYDGIAKTPEWASKICGTAPSTIRSLAQQMATIKPMSFKCGQAPARTYNGAQFAQMFYAIGWMTGNIGKPGMEVSACDGAAGVQGGPALVKLGDPLLKAPVNPVCTPPRGGLTLEQGKYDPDQYYGIAYADLWEAILTGKHTDFTRGTRDCNIKCLTKMGICATLNQLLGNTRAIEALRTPGNIEFSVSSDFFMQTDCLFSDIVLPAATFWERETLLIGSQVIKPYFESKPDWWMDSELAKRLGIPESVVASANPEADFPTRVATAKVVTADGDGSDYEPLAEVTEQDIKEMGLPIKPHSGRVPIRKLYEQGSYQLERSVGDPYAWVYLSDFRKDPVAHPVKTATGKLEIYSKALQEYYALFHTTPIDPLPKYVPAVEGYEDSFVDWEKKVKGEYPFQMVTPHQARQVHSAYYNVKSLNELFSNNLVINTLDAAKLGVKTNDTVLISSKHGKVLRRVQVAARVMPGVVLLGEGCWTDLNNKTGIDMGANVNTLTGAYLVGEGYSPFNTVLLKIEQWTGQPLDPDYKRPQRIYNL